MASVAGGYVMRVSELTGYDLDRAVALAAGHQFISVKGRGTLRFDGIQRRSKAGGVDQMPFYSPYFKRMVQDCDGPIVFQGTRLWIPSLDWLEGGLNIERERITLRVSTMPGTDWAAFYDVPGQYHAHVRERGDTGLLAAMRCFVAFKFGKYVELPKELHP